MQKEIKKSVEKQLGIVSISILIKDQVNAIVRSCNQIKKNYYGIKKDAIQSAVIKVMTNAEKEPELNRNNKGCAHLMLKPFTTDLTVDENGNNLIQWDNPIYCYLLSPRVKYTKYNKEHNPVECFSIRKDLLRNIKEAYEDGEVDNYEFIYFHGDKYNQIDSMYRIPFEFLWGRLERINELIENNTIKQAEEKDYLFTRLSAVEPFQVNYDNSELNDALKNQKFFYNNNGGFNIVEYLTKGADYLGTCSYAEYRTGLKAYLGFYENDKLVSNPIEFKSAGELYGFLESRGLITFSRKTLTRYIQAGRIIILENGLTIKVSENKESIAESIITKKQVEIKADDEKLIATVSVNLNEKELIEKNTTRKLNTRILRKSDNSYTNTNTDNNTEKLINPDECYFIGQSKVEEFIKKKIEIRKTQELDKIIERESIVKK